MTSTTPTRRSPRGFGHLIPGSVQLGGASLSRTIRLRPIHLVDEMLYIGLQEYQNGQSAAFMHTAHNAAELAAREEPYYVEHPPVNSQHLTTNSSELVGPLESPLSDNPWAEEVTDVVVPGRAAADRNRGPNGAAITRSKLVKALIGGVVSLIVLPGVILGVLVNTMAGIALSSVITALANLFAGLYYYLNKRD